MKLYRILLLLVLSLTMLHAEPRQAPDETLDRLAKIGSFGFGMEPSPGPQWPQGQKDYEDILARSTALTDLQEVFGKGTLSAKCYALIGIQILDPKLFEVLCSQLQKEDKTKININIGGDITNDQEPLGQILQEIKNGAYRTTPGMRSFPFENKEQTVDFLMASIIPELKIENMTVLEALKQVQVGGKFRRKGVTISI